ncbi:tRNA pseudouridine(65) synthase TruC [Nitrincola tibetensis]|uniref:tRNA pseudouridine synthase C n=1 Tax=Nitrincola tibetensis TaxID=2219697 RepID=A0A364NR69_9GAMM|nr:pseudouridine synthase [Nitrincola tibetensis]RAU19367.1 tRNA pseudouridine(65) synthase TruC [Nitrincola tibetensis]
MLTPTYTLDILYEDQWITVVNKPSGLLVHPSWISHPDEPTLVGLLKERYPDQVVHTVHRLDRATSGVIVFARDKEVVKSLNTQFAEGAVKKTYLCVARGWTEDEGRIDYALKPIYDKFADPLADPDKAPKPAITHYKTLARVELPIAVGRYPVARYSLLKVQPETGRKHQIRRHMKHILHPLVGDTNHGEGRHNRLFREHFDCHRLLLMATELYCQHPVTKESLHLKAPLDSQMLSLFDRLGWGNVQLFEI